MAESPTRDAETTDAGMGAQTLGELLNAIAQKTPAPGGGAVAGVAGALAASLANMVLAYSRGKKSLAQHAQAHQELASRCATASCRMLELADADAAAYAELNALQRLDADDPGRAGLPETAQRCVEVPHEAQRVCLGLLEAFEALVPIANPWLLSDLKISAILAEAAVRACACNVHVNAPTLAEAVSPSAAEAALLASAGACEQARARLDKVVDLIDAASDA